MLPKLRKSEKVKVAFLILSATRSKELATISVFRATSKLSGLFKTLNTDKTASAAVFVVNFFRTNIPKTAAYSGWTGQR